MKNNQKLHLALGVKDINESIKDYSRRFSCDPVVIIDNQYALFRTETFNLSIRRVDVESIGLRHLGFESEDYSEFQSDKDCNGFLWETFSKQDQIKEIVEMWPDSISDNPYLE